MSRSILKSTVIDDRDANVTYYATSGTWTVHTGVQSIFHLWGNTDTFHDQQGSTATLRFYGNAIEYWGNQGPYHGPCAISIDGEELETVNSHAASDGYPIMLYSKNDLTLGDHVLEVKIVDPSYPNVCEIDRFVANITSTSGTTTDNGGGVGGDRGDGGNGNPPIAAIAGGVGGAAVLCLLLVGFWLYKRSQNKKAQLAGGGAVGGAKLGKPAKPAKGGKSPKNGGVVPLLSDGLPAGTPDIEKQGYTSSHNGQAPWAPSSPPASSYNPPSSYNPGSPPPGATVGFNPHTLSYGTHSPAPSSVAGTVPLPNSPQTIVRPMSTMTTTSAAPTMSYYTSGAESSAFTGYAPHQQQQQQHYQQPASPAWATPEPTSSPAPVSAHHQPLAPSPSASPAPSAAHHAAPSSATASFPPEKAQYRSEKSGYSGSNVGASTAGGSGSGPGPSSGASASGDAHNDIMSPQVPDLPPPAYA